MKVLIVAQSYVSKTGDKISIPGGTERYAYGLAKQLKDDNYEVIILTTKQNKNEVNFENLDGIDTYRIYISPRFYRYLGDIYVFFNVINLIRSFDPEVVHAVSPVYKFSAGAILATRLLGKKGVYTRTTFPHEEGRRLLPVFFDRYILANIFRMADATIVLSNHMKKAMDTKFPNVQVIPSFITGEYYKKIPKEPLSILYVGRLDKFKGIDVLIESLYYVKDKVPGVKLHIVGNGEYLDQLINLMNFYGLEESIIFEGHLKDSELAEVYSRSDIFIFPSFREGMPMALIEAMNAGLPIIASDIEPCVELLEGGKYGILVKKGDPKALAENICKLIVDEKLKKHYSDLCLEKSKQYLQEKVVKKIECLYGLILQGKTQIGASIRY